MPLNIPVITGENVLDMGSDNGQGFVAMATDPNT